MLKQCFIVNRAQVSICTVLSIEKCSYTSRPRAVLVLIKAPNRPHTHIWHIIAIIAIIAMIANRQHFCRSLALAGRPRHSAIASSVCWRRVHGCCPCLFLCVQIGAFAKKKIHLQNLIFFAKRVHAAALALADSIHTGKAAGCRLRRC